MVSLSVIGVGARRPAPPGVVGYLIMAAAAYSESSSNKGKYAAAILLIAAGISLWYFWPDDGSPPDEVPLFCVKTGETVYLNRIDVISLPAVNPKTQEATLLPFVEKEDGRYIGERYGDALGIFGDDNRYVDPETLRIKDRP